MRLLAVSIGLSFTVLVACDHPATSTPAPPTADTPPATATPTPTSRDVVANGACWVLDADPGGAIFLNTRWVYENNLLQRVEHYEEDRKTLRFTDTYEHDAQGRLVAETSAWSGEPPHRRTEYHRDASGHLRGTTSTKDGEPDSSGEYKVDAQGRFAGTVHRKKDGSVYESWNRWAKTESGGWSITSSSRTETPAKGREPARVDEREDEPTLLDARGRTIERRGGGECKEATFPPVLRAKIRREYGARPNDATTTYELGGKVSTVRHELDVAGNLVAIVRETKSTRFEYEGEFRNAVCHVVEPRAWAEYEGRYCDIAER